MNLISKNMGSRLRIIITGYILRWPLGGNAWAYLQYVLGLSKLGHEVYYVEESGDSPYCCYNPSRYTSDTNPDYGLKFTAQAFDSLGLKDCWAYYDAHTSTWLGPRADNILEICATADLVLRMPAMADSLAPWLEQIPTKVLVDIDPVFTQLRYLGDANAKRDAQRYTNYLSFGENISRGTAKIPDDGFPWQTTRPTIVLDAWPVTPGSNQGNYTTIMKWKSYPAGEYKGVRYGMKLESFQPYIDLPEKTNPGLELTVDGGHKVNQDLAQKGWQFCNPLEITRDLWTYQHYIQQSKAEFSVAKQGYVISNSGWFSDRSVCYLASGRPVLLQDTGFSEWLETGAGVISFNNPDEALAGIEEINSRYEFHCQAARDIAQEYFDSEKVLSRLLDLVFEKKPRKIELHRK